MKIENFKYAEDLKIDLPLMILGIRARSLDDDKERYNFKEGREFINLAHQTAGHSCSQLYFNATILEPTEVGLKLMMKVNRRYLDSEIGWFGGPTLEQANEYKEILNRFGVDCNCSYLDLTEAAYPIDLKPEYLKILCKDQLPEDLDSLIEFKTPLDRALGCLNRWDLFILGDNCD